MRYTFTHRNKWLTANAESIDNMIDDLQLAVNRLRGLKEAGVTLNLESDIYDDRAELITESKEIADKYGFTPAVDEEVWEDVATWYDESDIDLLDEM